MNYKPKTISRWLLSLLGIFIFTTSFAFKNTLDKKVNGQDPDDARIEEGSKLFATNCASCHALDGIVVGPALGKVVNKYDEDYEWLLAWIKNNAKLRASGDERANKIYDEYKGANMTAFANLSDDQITSVLMWIENGGDGDAPVQTETVEEVVVDDSLFGKVNWGVFLMALLVGVIMLMIFGILELVGNITGKQVINWNNVNAYMMLIFLVVFFALVIWEFKVHGDMVLKVSASEHGVELDNMMNMTYYATIPVFFITQFLLFWFSFKYRRKEGQKALYYPHNNNLELIWTVVPAIVLALLVSKGFVTWNKILRDDSITENTPKIEVFAEQFMWRARYEGSDGILGKASYNLINPVNPLGVANREHATALIDELKGEIEAFEKGIARIPSELAELKSTLGGLVDREREEHLMKIHEYESGDKQKELELLIRARNTQIGRLEKSLEVKNGSMYDGTGDDDQVVSEIHLVVNEPVTFKFRARDVIHSAYLPYFRTQMNVVPGLPTEFTFKPTITTNDMRQRKKDAEFDYYLVCNKICGDAHYNMKMKVVVEDAETHKKWLATQAPLFKAAEETPSEEEESTTEESEEEVVVLN